MVALFPRIGKTSAGTRKNVQYREIKSVSRGGRLIEVQSAYLLEW